MNGYPRKEPDVYQDFQSASRRLGIFPSKARIQKVRKLSAQRLNQLASRSAAVQGLGGPRSVRLEQKEAISTLAGGIAHQFNNNLFVITANLELLEMQGSQDPNGARRIEASKGAAQRMTEMTRQLLDYASSRKYHPRPISLTDLVRERLPHIQRALGPTVPVEADLGAEVWKNQCRSDADENGAGGPAGQRRGGAERRRQSQDLLQKQSAAEK